ncbi:MAG: hypothetical protein NUW07_02340 [Candidatus Saccharicenans sp.]|jgi:hypothetical protein|nr:hypothetical protein [Candidatus Saccharicenans sp.]
MKRRLQCLLVDLSWRLIPVAGFRSWLLRKHLDRCPACQNRLVGREEARRLISQVKASWPTGVIARAEAAVGREEKGSDRSSVLGGQSWWVRVYAGLVAMTIIILMAAFGWYLGRQRNSLRSLPGNETIETKIVSKVSLRYVRAKGQPATTYIFRTDDPEMVIIWVEAVN